MATKTQSFFQRIDDIYPSLTAMQARIADYLRTNYRQSVFYTLSQAAEATEASEASVIRFARMIGYDGFSGMQEAVRAYVSASMRSTVERFRSLEAKADGSPGWDQLIESGVRTLQGLPQLVASDDVTGLAEALSSYHSIVLVGFESTAGFAEYLSYYLSRAGFSVETISERTGNLFPHIRRAGADTLVLSIMVARYPRQAVQFCHECRLRGATIAVVSDTADHPLRDDVSFQFSIATRRSDGMNMEIQVALFATLQLLILKAGLRDVDRTRSVLAELEAYDSAFGVFD